MPTILIADESSVRRRIIASVLEQAGFDVLSAVDGLDAVRAVFLRRPDAVVLGVQMPRLSGHVVTRLLKDDRQTAHVPIIIITSREAAADRYWGEQTGADRFLSKDFGAAELVSAVHDVLQSAQSQHGGQRPAEAASVGLDDDDVLARVSELLDRKLFEAKISAEMTKIAADVIGFEETVAAVLDVLGRIVDYDLAAICLLDTRVTYLSVARESSHRHYREFCHAIADAVMNLVGQPVMVTDLVPRVADPEGLLGAEDDGALETFVSVPLRARGRILGCLAVSSATSHAFDGAALDAIHVIEQPVAVVLSNAQLGAAPASGVA